MARLQQILAKKDLQKGGKEGREEGGEREKRKEEEGEGEKGEKERERKGGR